MSTGPPPKGRVYEKTGLAASKPRGHGMRQSFRAVLVEIRKRGRPADPRTAELAARIKGPEFEEFGSFRRKCRELAWRLHLEAAGDPDITPLELDLETRAENLRVAIRRWDKKHS